MTDEISEWCARRLGARPLEELFRRTHLTGVVALVLSDGRSVVIKIRPPSTRLQAITTIQRLLHARGFPCPEVLAGPAPLGARVATAETYVAPSGKPPDRVPPEPVAELLAELMELAPPPTEFGGLDPAPPWVGWDHDRDGIWPWPDDLDLDLNQYPGPHWIEDVAIRVRERLRHVESPPVIGHIDWEAQNFDWHDDIPVVVHDWDSLAIRPEATIAGAAAATFTSNGRDNVAATVADTAAFLDAYRQRRPGWTSCDTEIGWCAGLWVLIYNAKKEFLGGGTGYLDHLQRELDERVARAGL
jgi:hypothetical protein